MRTNMDYLLMGSFLLEKKEQKPLEKNRDWLREYGLD
jgi:carbamoyltransferase